MISNNPRAQPHLRSGSQTNNRMPGDYGRHQSTGSLTIPNNLRPQNGAGNGSPQTMAALSRFEGPRSPPNKQNTSHVPCKFFRQGACQAGKACPFSHDLATTAENVCKYFAKGNCKFGPKCANVHVLPNGHRVNYQKNGMITAGPPLNIGGRVPPGQYQSQGSALTNSFIRNDGSPMLPYGQSMYGGQLQSSDENFPAMPVRQSTYDINGVPTIDTTYTSHPGSQYGSPRDDELANRLQQIALSPTANRGLSVLDAPLPSSFDSNGISNIAKQGKLGASVPSRFGFESPPQSIGSAKDGRTSEALKNLHSSAFGDDIRDRFNGIASSPPPAYGNEEYFGKRPMHSQRPNRTRIMSASVPKAADKDWESDFAFEEDYLPDNLKELLTPQEKARRDSRNADEEGRPILSGSGTPHDSSSKFGSPSNASPSRWGPLWERKRQEDEEKARNALFSHVGSPLRNSHLHQGASPIQRAISRPGTNSGDVSPYVASPPRPNSMSIISQQLKRTRLSRAESSGSETGLPASAARTSNPIGTPATRNELDRQFSSSSIGRFTTPIDEEQGDFVFSMEEEEDRESKRSSGGWGYPTGGRSPHLGAIGSSRSNGNGAAAQNGNGH